MDINNNVSVMFSKRIMIVGIMSNIYIYIHIYTYIYLSLGTLVPNSRD